MSLATVYSTAQFGLADESSATGLYVGSITWTGQSEQVKVPNHIGATVGFCVYDASKTVSADGVIATKGTGLVDTIGSVITLANTTHSARTRNSEGLGDGVTGAGLIVVGNTISPTGTGFEGGGMEMVYFPNLTTSSPTTITS
jgi:hypothetical protein